MTEQERDTKNSCHPRVSSKGTGQESAPPGEKAGMMAKGIGVAEPSAGGSVYRKGWLGPEVRPPRGDKRNTG